MFTKRTIRFQSTLPREERQILILFNRFECLFQSTLPREERRGIASLGSLFKIYFNPRSHERSDLVFFIDCDSLTLFQSTLPREERPIFFCYSTLTKGFQSTLPREERQQYCTKNLFIFIQYRQ